MDIFQRHLLDIHHRPEMLSTEEKRRENQATIIVKRQSFFFFFFFLHFKFKNVKTYFHLEGHIRAGSEPDPAHRLWFANP